MNWVLTPKYGAIGAAIATAISFFFVWYEKPGIFSFLGFMTIFSQDSDSAYFALGAILAVLVYLCFKKDEYVLRFLELIIILVLAGRIMGILVSRFGDPEYSLDTISLFILNHFVMWIVLLVVIVFYVLIFIKRTLNSEKSEISKFGIVGKIFALLFLISIPLWAVLIVLTTTGVTGFLKDGQLSNYFYFEDWWGNSRGYNWRVTMALFNDFDLKNKLIGAGPDCFGYYAYNHLYDLASSYYNGDNLVCAHNEWLNMLITSGILGFVSYTGWFIAFFVEGIRSFKRRVDEKDFDPIKLPIVLGSVMCTASYFYHNLFCYQTCCCTPFIMAIMGMGAYYLREEEKLN